MTATRLPAPHRWMLVAGSVLAWLAATAWVRPLMLPDEGRYVGIAWEMLRSGDWLTPTLDGLPYFHKPPLFYWITAASLWAFGPNDAAARAAPLLGAWTGALATYLFARRWWGPPLARLALLALLAQPLFFVSAQFANLDMLVAGCITLTILLLADAALRVERGLPHRRPLVAAWAMAGLGVLAKGLIGAVIPALVVGLWLVSLRRWRVLATLLWWPGPVVFALVAAPWFVAMQMRHPAFLDYFFVVQHFRRFAEGGFNNAQPIWFFAALLLLFQLPWLPWLARSFKRSRPPDCDPARGPLRRLSWLWAATVLVFFSLPQSKLVGYILPAVAPLALLAADGFAAQGTPTVRATRLWWAGTALAAAAGFATAVALAVQPQRSTRDVASALAARRAPNEPVLMLGNYYFDLPYYAALRAPVRVVDDRLRTEAELRDNWRKELGDAGRFAPQRAADTLIAAGSLPRYLCLSAVSWVVGPANEGARHPALAVARVAFTGRNATLWRVDRDAALTAGLIRCEGTPNDGSSDR